MSFAKGFMAVHPTAASQGASAFLRRSEREDEIRRLKAEETAKLRREAKSIANSFPETFSQGDIPFIMDQLTAGIDVTELALKGLISRKSPRTTDSETSKPAETVRSEAADIPLTPTEERVQQERQAATRGPESNQEARRTNLPEAPTDGSIGFSPEYLAGRPEAPTDGSVGFTPSYLAGRPEAPTDGSAQGVLPSRPEASTDSNVPLPPPRPADPSSAVPQTSQVQPSALEAAGVAPRTPDSALGSYEMPAGGLSAIGQPPASAANPGMPNAGGVAPRTPVQSAGNEFMQVSPLDTQTQEVFNTPAQSQPLQTQGPQVPPQASATQPSVAPSQASVATPPPQASATQPATPPAQSSVAATRNPATGRSVALGGGFQINFPPPERDLAKSPSAIVAQIAQEDPTYLSAQASGDSEGMARRLGQIQAAASTPDEASWEDFAARITSEEDIDNLRIQRTAYEAQGRDQHANFIDTILRRREQIAAERPPQRTWAYRPEARPGQDSPSWLLKDSDGRILDPETREVLPGAVELDEDERQSMSSLISDGQQEFRTLTTVSENRDRFLKQAMEINEIVRRNEDVLLPSTEMLTAVQGFGLDVRNVVGAISKLNPLSIMDDTAEDMGISVDEVQTLQGEDADRFLAGYRDRMRAAHRTAESSVNGALREFNLTESSDPLRRELGQLLEDYRQYRSAMTFFTFEAGRVEGLEGRALSNLNYNEIKAALERPRTHQAFEKTLAGYVSRVDDRTRSDIRSALASNSVQAFRERYWTDDRAFEMSVMPNLRLSMKAADESNLGLVTPAVWLASATDSMATIFDADELSSITSQVDSLGFEKGTPEYSNALSQNIIERERQRGNTDFGMDSMATIGNTVYVIGPSRNNSDLLTLHHASGNPQRPLRLTDVIQ